MIRIFVFAAVLLGVLFAQKVPFTLQTLYDLKGVSDPQISPDGERIAFVVTTYDLQEGTSNSDIYLMDANGGNQRRMTQNHAADYHPRWSPDGSKILFVSDRENGDQAWVLPVNGGEAEQLTDFSAGVSNPEWVGNSNDIIFESTVYPECGADQKCNDDILESIEAGPLQARMADHLLYRHWTFYKDGMRTHLIRFKAGDKSYSDVTPGDYDSPALWGSYTISADGQWLCVESNRDVFEAETTNKDLFLINLNSGATRNLTVDNEAYDGQPVFSPDGRYIAYQKQVVPVFEADRTRLAIYDFKQGKSRVLTEDFDAWTENYKWSADSRYIYFTAPQKGHFPVYRVQPNAKKIEQIADVKTIDDFNISPDGKWLAISRRTIAEPSEIVRAEVKNGKSTRLTFLNKAIEDSVDIRPAKEMWISSPTGKKIHTYVVLPHNFDETKKYPLILNVHGGPQMQWYDGFRGDWQVYPGSGYIVAFPNPHGSSGYGQEFTNAISRDWTGKVYDDVMAVTDYLADLPYVDEEHMGAMGWSYGGYMMMWMEGHTNRFKAIVSMMGVYNLPAMYGSTEELWFPDWDLGGAPWEKPQEYQKMSPHNYVENFKTPCLVITGEKDYRVPYTQSLEFFTGLQKMRVPSRLIVFPDDGHWPSYTKSMPFYYNAHLDWFHKYLGGEPAPYEMQKMLRNQAF